MRVCVTGGAGFIGTHLCALLRDRGHDVVAVDRRAAPTTVPGVELVRADVATEPVAPWLDGADAVFHLAALPGVRSLHERGALRRDNVEATDRVARAAAARGVRFVLASTSSVYGQASLLPTPEDAALAPLNPYARSKVAAEAAGRRAGGDVVVARLFTVYGPGQRPDMAFARWLGALREGRPLHWCAPPCGARELTYVEDAARGLLAALEHGRAGRTYNIAGGGSVALTEALAELERLTGRRAELQRVAPSPFEAAITAADGRRAAAELGHRARVTLREGLTAQVEATEGALPVAA